MKDLRYVAALALTICTAAAREAPAAPPAEDAAVVDDYAIEYRFGKQVGKMADQKATLHGLKNIRKLLQAVAGKTVEVPTPATAPGTPAAPEKGVLIAGVVYRCKDCTKWHSGGLAGAWVLSSDGLIVTNHHVLDMEDEPEDDVFLGVMDRDGNVFAVKEILADDHDADIAVLRVDVGSRTLHPLPLALHAPAAGTPVAVISHPDGRYYCLSKGHVTRYHRQPVDENAIDKALDGQTVPMTTWMSISADFGVGSSGAPVLDEQGQVIGMICLTETVIATADEKEAAEPPADGVQMVFKDCVPVPALRKVIRTKDE